jgi:serine/threonine-protein kinase
LQHPNIVSVYDSDRHGDMAYLVMEFIQGEDLKQHLDGGKRYALSQSLGMVADLLAALDYAHRQNIVHRDVKPANLLIESNGRVKLTDFGVARIQDSGEATRTQGAMVGTLKYMSPEQVQGVPIDTRADLFAVGVVLYQLLTGKRPFDGDTDFAIIQQIVGHTPAAPSSFSSSLPAALDAVVARALAKKREQRFATAQDFAVALQQASGQALDPTVVPPVSQAGRPAGMPTHTGRQASRTGGSIVRVNESGTGTGSGPGSTVTQELELVYWKDIKDSDDLADLQGFLDKFPSGIYADLARRRVRKLGGGVSADGSDTGSQATLVALPSDSGEWTRLQVQHTQASSTSPSVAVQPSVGAAALWPAVAGAAAPPRGDNLAFSTSALVVDPPAIPAADSQAAPDSASGSPPQADPGAQPVAASAGSTRAPTTAASGRRLKLPVIWVAGAALLLVIVLAIQGLSGPSVPASDVQADAPATALGSVTTPALNLAGTDRAAPAAVPASTVSAKPMVTRAAPAVTEKPALTSPMPVKPGSGEGYAPPSIVPTPAVLAYPVGPINPRQVCDNRVFLGFQSCMNEQCAKPTFSKHPVCVERSNQEKLRRESQEQRN